MLILENKLEAINSKIYTVRGVKVMLDRDLAELYQVETRVLNQAVKRNLERFSEDFMFQLTSDEWHSLRSQFVILKNIGRGGHLKYMPYVFTEYGTLMLASILNSLVAIQVNQKIIRAFVELRNSISVKPEYDQLKQQVRQIELQVELTSERNVVDHTLFERKLMSMSGDICRISEVLDEFQSGHIVIKRVDDDIKEG